MKRFWKTVTTEETPDGWRVLLDGRPVSTPARRPCVVPLAEMAAAIAEEWAAQKDQVRPQDMPMTRTAATCLDRVEPQELAIRETLATYGETDLLCYRATHPDALIHRQQEAWDPVLDWAADKFDAPLVRGAGVMHISQPARSVANLANALAACTPWQLTAMADLIQMSGSLVLALGVLHKYMEADQAWALSRIDDQWNIDEWGEDAEAAADAAKRMADFKHAARVLKMLDV